MKDPRCLIGHHEWETKINVEGEPYEVCSRPNCLKVRKTSSPFHADGATPNTRYKPPPWWE